jgi:hypothetical protein
VLEPLQANPTIIEDNCFIGARSEIVEGVIVEAHSVISMGVFIGQSTKIYDRASGEVQLRPRAVRLGGRPRQPAVSRRQVLAGLRHHREARRRRHASEDLPSTSCSEPDVSTPRDRDDVHRRTLDLARALIARPSLTPEDGGCLELVADRLRAAGFVCERIDRGAVRNLWAVHGAEPPVVCLAGTRRRGAAWPRAKRGPAIPFTPTSARDCCSDVARRT